MKKRIVYGILTFLLLFIEVLIALFVHDCIIRPYVGDILVVILLYTFVRIWIPEKIRLLPLYIFLFASCVELLQMIHIVEILGVENNTFLRVLMGSVFDVQDIVCYGIGCTILGIYELVILFKQRE